MADLCKTCKWYNRDSSTVQLPNGDELVLEGFIENAGGSGYEIAKCVQNENFWENITRDVSTAAFFDSAAKRSVFEHAGLIGVGENDVCPLYEPIEVASITVIGFGGVDYVENGATLQMVADVLPTNAADTSVTWSVVNGTGTATIDSGTGVLSGTGIGTVTVIATANDGSGVTGELVVNVVELVTSITVSGFGGATQVELDGELQMIADVLPITATNQTVTWSVTSGTGTATIDSFTGILKGASLGTVTVRATATDGTLIYGEVEITVV